MKNPQVFEPIVFIEGVRIPFSSLTVTVKANYPSTLMLAVPAINQFKQLLPRSLVHVFINDPDQISNKEKTQTINRLVKRGKIRTSIPRAEGLTGSEKEILDRELDFDKYRLFWEGELIGWSYAKITNQRSLTLTCLDLSNYWLTSYAYLFSDFEKESMIPDHLIAVAAPDGNPNCSQSIPNKQTISGELDNILRNLSNFSAPLAFNHMFTSAQEIGEFFRLANIRLRLTDIINPKNKSPEGKIPEFDNAGQRVLKDQDARGKVAFLLDEESKFLYLDDPFNKNNSAIASFASYFIGVNRTTASLTEVLERLMSIFYYQYWPCPAAALVEDGIPRAILTDSTTGRDIYALGREGYRINSFFIKPSTFYTAPPACNVLFPEMIQGYQTSQNYLEEPTRLALKIPPQTIEGVFYKNIYFAPAQLKDIIEASLLLRNRACGEVGNSGSGQVRDKTADEVRQDVKATGHLVGVLPENDNGATRLYRTLLSTGVNQESREDHKGVLSADIDLPIEALLLNQLAGESREKYLAQIAEYELWLAQHRSRGFTVSGPFNPYIVPGFPLCVLDSEIPTFAEVGAITWSIDANGMGSYNIQGIYPRNDDVFRTIDISQISGPGGLVPITNIEDILFKPINGIPNPAFNFPPNWLNISYRPEIIGGFPSGAGDIVTFESSKYIRGHTTKLEQEIKLKPYQGDLRERFAAYPFLLGKKTIVDEHGNSVEQPMRSILQSYGGATKHRPDTGSTNNSDIDLGFVTVPIPSTVTGDGDIILGPIVDIPTPTGYSFNQRVAAELLLKDYNNIEDLSERSSFVWNYTRRTMPSMRQTFEYIGAKIVNFDLVVNDDLRGREFLEELAPAEREFGKPGPFRKEYQEIAKKIQEIIPPGRIGGSTEQGMAVQVSD